MIGRIARARASRPSSMALVAVPAALVLLIVVGVLASQKASHGGGAQRALEQYEAAIAPAVEQAGKAIVAGIRPDLADFEAGRISAQVWQENLRVHRATFERARATIARARAPDEIDDAPAWFDESMQLYVEATRVLERAGTMDGQGRVELLEAGATIGERADGLFDRGAARIQAARQAHGLPPSARLPTGLG